jgi:hypothetical protein
LIYLAKEQKGMGGDISLMGKRAHNPDTSPV